MGIFSEPKRHCENSRKYRVKDIGFVKQDFALIEDYTAFDNVMLPLYPIKAKDKNKIALAALKKMGIERLSEKETRTLSAVKNSVLPLARAIVNEPSIILADEPTGSLDSKTTVEIMNVFRNLNSKGKTVVIVTHDQGIAAQCGRIIEISDGQIVSE